MFSLLSLSTDSSKTQYDIPMWPDNKGRWILSYQQSVFFLIKFLVLPVKPAKERGRLRTVGAPGKQQRMGPSTMKKLCHKHTYKLKFMKNEKRMKKENIKFVILKQQNLG